jgi:hypothetical protein
VTPCIVYFWGDPTEFFFLKKRVIDFLYQLAISRTANEGPVRIQYKCLVPVYVFPERKLLVPKNNFNVLSPSPYTHISVRDLYISRMIWSPFTELERIYAFKATTKKKYTVIVFFVMYQRVSCLV